MKIASHQAILGAAIAAAVTISAVSGSHGAGGPATYAAFTALNREPVATVAEQLGVCGDKALAFALDAAGEIAGYLKQL